MAAHSRRPRRGSISIDALRHIVRLTVALVALATVANATVANAQIVRQSTWSIQDPERGLRQVLAETVIANADAWLTREDPDAPIARLDDRVRVTVVDEIDPATGRTRARLAQLVLGTIVIDRGFEEFLDPTTIESLVRRDHLWRDESVVEFNGMGEPTRVLTARDFAGDIGAEPERPQPRIRVGLDESSIRIGDRIRLFEALGYEMLALPGTSYSRLRAGVEYDRVRMWGELPLPLGSASTPAIARTLEAAFGAGLSFESAHFGGAITWSDPGSMIGKPALEGDSLFVLSRSAIFTWTIPLHNISGDDGLVLRVGGAYRQFVPLVGGAEIRREADPIDVPTILLRGEYESVVDNQVRRSAAAEIFGTSVVLSYHEQFSRLLGLRLVGAVHGLIGGRPSYLPAYTVLITPTLTFW